MAVIAADPLEASARPGHRGLISFCEVVDEALEPHERRIARVHLGDQDQARICFERMRGFALHPALEDQLIVRHLELRHEDEEGLRLLRVVVSEGARVHGLSSSLYIGDEIWA